MPMPSRRTCLVVLAVVTIACESGTGPAGTSTMRSVGVAGATGGVDAAVTTRPAVVVEDAGRRKTAGVSVMFTVVAGGGSVTGGTATTNADGVATVGTWTLGPTPTANVLEATAEGYAPVRFVVDARWARRIAANDNGACAITSRMYCWGDNSHGEFGTGLASQTWSAAPVAAGITTVTRFATGNGQHSCGFTAASDGVCWGRANWGQLGAGTVGGATGGPSTVLGGPWAVLATSRLTTCGVRDVPGASAYCWGSNQAGELGPPAAPISTGAMYPAPTQVTPTIAFRSVSAGWQHACGIAADSSAYCWGSNRLGQAGTGTTDTIVRGPTRVAGAEKFVVLSLSAHHSCGLTADGRALCWGQNAFGQLGDGSTTVRRAPTPVAGGLRFTAIAVGGMYLLGPPPGVAAPGSSAAGHTCALAESGAPYCWGWNAWGQLGDGTTIDRPQPTAVVGALRLSGLALGEGHSCGMRGTSVWCWGANTLGQIGDGSMTARTAPVRVALP